MNADLDAIEVREITVQRTFADFEDFWTTSMMSATVSQTIAAMAPGDAELLKMRMRARLPAISCPCCDARKNKREGCACLKPLQTLKAGIPFGRPYSAPFSVW
jgi:hypothetical protein